MHELSDNLKIKMQELKEFSSSTKVGRICIILSVISVIPSITFC
ncbi:hypothetical protein [Wolbachia pipientis]|nr:hypothetical protein [Wolbachia pipientis]